MATRDLIHEPLILGGQIVPGVWRYLLPPELGAARLPAERRATCNACPKIENDGFRPDYRCCTYHPRIPNFLLGLALGSGRQIATAAVRDILTRGFVIPEGTERSPAKWLAILRQDHDDAYGKGEHVLCPLLDRASGFCKVHAFRNGVCSTYFCMYDHGAHGSRFWEVLQEYVSVAETALGQWALRKVGFDLAAYFARLDGLAVDLPGASSACEDSWSKDALRILWGDAFGKEEELLRATARAVSEHRDQLRALVEETPILRPAAFEKAEIMSVPADLQYQIDPRERLAQDTASTPPMPLASYGMLVQEALAALHAVPPPDTTLALADGVRCEDGRVYFPAQEAEGSWDLDLVAGEAEALAVFETPRPLIEARRALDFATLENPDDFLARWLGYGVLRRCENV